MQFVVDFISRASQSRHTLTVMTSVVDSLQQMPNAHLLTLSIISACRYVCVCVPSSLHGSL